MGENPDATRIEAGSAGVASTGGGDDRRSDGASLIGKPLPAFSLVKLDGRTVSQQTLAGKPSVIVFGSHSAPSFRDRVPPLQELASQYGQKVNWLIVYTAEQFPTGVEQPERNIEDKIAIAPHKQFEERAAAARTARDALKVKLDVAPDEIGNTLTTRLAGMPNAAVVVDKDGTVVAHQRWADPFAIRRAVEEALKAAP